MLQRASNRRQAIKLVAIGLLVFLAPLIFADSTYRQVAGAIGIAVFVITAMRYHALSRRLQPSDRRHDT